MLHKQETNNYNNKLWQKLDYVIITGCVQKLVYIHKCVHEMFCVNLWVEAR